MMLHASEEKGPRRYLAKAQRTRNARWPHYVFIHINKTAGSSIERALYLRFEHRTAVEKREELGARRWQRAFKFAFVRNPWTRALSHYEYRVKTNQTGLGDRHLCFREWVLAALRDRDPRYRDQELMFQSQWHWISDHAGHCLVDYIGRFENLQSDFASLCRILGKAGSLPHLKRSAPHEVTEQYNSETREIVAHHYRVDIEKFHYSFPAQTGPMVCTGHGS